MVVFLKADSHVSIDPDAEKLKGRSGIVTYEEKSTFYDY